MYVKLVQRIDWHRPAASETANITGMGVCMRDDVMYDG